MAWQDIETAAKDGGVKLGWQDGCVFAMVWRLPIWLRFRMVDGPDCAPAGGDWVVQGYGRPCTSHSGGWHIVKPTHWQPLPDPPERQFYRQVPQ